MSMFRYMFDSDWFQRADIDRLAARSQGLANQLGRANSSTRVLKEQVAQLQSDLAEMTLFNKTLLRMLVEKQVCAPEEFTNLLDMIDLEDGVKDGQVTQPQALSERKLCTHCRKAMPRNKPRCMYCGHAAS